MFAALLRRFASGHKPRFADWPAPPELLPPLDLSARTLGPLRFGASLDDIRAFGRPDRHTRIPPDTDEFLYAPLGLIVQLDAQHGIDYLAVLIAPDPYDPKHPRLRHATPRLASGHTLTPATTEADLLLGDRPKPQSAKNPRTKGTHDERRPHRRPENRPIRLKTSLAPGIINYLHPMPHPISLAPPWHLPCLDAAREQPDIDHKT